jgi:isopenicillin N synthase-like dioxygenase
MTHQLPRIDISALFGPASRVRDGVDAAIRRAAREEGMMTVTGLPEWALPTRQRRQALLRIFSLPEDEIRQLWRWNFDPARPNVYRGWFPLQDGQATYKEGIDFGPDLAYGPSVVDATDPLREASPLPLEASLPGWHAAARDHYLSMVRVSQALMHSIARGLGLPQDIFDPAFDKGISTLRLLRYPPRPASSLVGADPAEVWAGDAQDRRYLLARGHVDTGFMTLLAQDGVPGLQAQHRDGTWLDLPPEEGTLAVNFGKVLQLWTGGRIRATLHRVVGTGQLRHSIPFFYEAAVDAVIAPLPLPDAEPFEPFYFGDYLWDTTTRFVEQKGIAHLRRPRGRPAPVDAATSGLKPR